MDFFFQVPEGLAEGPGTVCCLPINVTFPFKKEQSVTSVIPGSNHLGFTLRVAWLVQGGGTSNSRVAHSSKSASRRMTYSVAQGGGLDESVENLSYPPGACTFPQNPIISDPNYHTFMTLCPPPKKMANTCEKTHGESFGRVSSFGQFE